MAMRPPFLGEQRGSAPLTAVPPVWPGGAPGGNGQGRHAAPRRGSAREPCDSSTVTEHQPSSAKSSTPRTPCLVAAASRRPGPHLHSQRGRRGIGATNPQGHAQFRSGIGNGAGSEPLTRRRARARFHRAAAGLGDTIGPTTLLRDLLRRHGHGTARLRRPRAPSALPDRYRRSRLGHSDARGCGRRRRLMRNGPRWRRSEIPCAFDAPSNTDAASGFDRDNSGEVAPEEDRNHGENALGFCSSRATGRSGSTSASRRGPRRRRWRGPFPGEQARRRRAGLTG